MAHRIEEIMDMGPTPPVGPSHNRMKWQPGMAVSGAGIRKNPRFNVPGPTDKVRLNYAQTSDLDAILDQIAAENAQPPHKKNAAKISALKQQAQEIAKRLESQWVQQNADTLLPRLDENQATG